MWENRQDSYTVMRALSALQNPYTGLGTARDKSQQFVINAVPLLSDQEIIDLHMNSMIARRVVDAYPEEANTGWCEFTFGANRYKNYGFNPETLNEYLNNLKTGSLRENIVDASIEARKHGNAYLLLGIDDGQAWDMPVDEKRIRRLAYAEPLYDHEVNPDTRTGYRNPEYYRINRYAGQSLPEGDRNLRVHRSRVIPLYGHGLTGQALQLNGGKRLSVYQSMFSALAQFLQAIMSSSAMLADYSFFRYKLKGLSKIIDKYKQDAKKCGLADDQITGYPPELMARFLSIQMGMSVLKGLMMDADGEEADFVNRNYGGVRDINDGLLEFMVANCDMPRSQVLGTSAKAGLGTEGRGEQDRYHWASLVVRYRENNWRTPLNYCGRLVLLSQDGPTSGRLPQGYGLQFPSTLQLTQSEELTLRKTHAETVNILIANGTLNPYEVRMSAYGAPKWTPEIIIDESISNNMKDSLFPTQEEIPQKEPPQEDEQVNKDEWRHDDSTPARRIIEWNGFKIGLQYLPFQLRHGKVLPCGYGHFQKTKGADNMAVDCYVGVNLNSNKIFEVEQLVNGEFDEVKIIIGVETIEEARALYLSVMPEEMFGGIEEITLEQLAEYKTSEETRADAGAVYGVWFSGRRTPIVVRASDRSEAISKARARKKRGGDTVDTCRLLNEKESSQAAKGNWVRTGAKGESPGYNKSKHGYGPTPKRDAFEDIPNYRPSDGANKCDNCQSGYSARRDGSGWYACDKFGHEAKRNWVCDDWTERVKQLRADDSTSFFWSGGELPVTSGNVYAINHENGGVLAFGYNSLEDAEIAFEYEFDIDIENGADVTDLLSQRVDELNFDDKNKVVRGNLCRDPRGRFVSCGKPVTKVESSLAEKRRENKEAREKAKLEPKPKPEDSKKVPDKKPKPKKATNEPNKQSKAAKDISENLVSFVNQMGAKQGVKERVAIDATDIMDNLVKKHGKQSVLNQLNEELKNIDKSISSGRIKRPSGLTHTEPFTNNLRWAKSYIEDNF